MPLFDSLKSSTSLLLIYNNYHIILINNLIVILQQEEYVEVVFSNLWLWPHQWEILIALTLFLYWSHSELISLPLSQQSAIWNWNVLSQICYMSLLEQTIITNTVIKIITDPIYYFGIIGILSNNKVHFPFLRTNCFIENIGLIVTVRKFDIITWN